MLFRQICFGLALALGLSGPQAGAATLTVFGGPVGGGCNNFACYSGPPTSGALRIRTGPADERPFFMSYNGSVTGRGMFADFSIFGFRNNSGSLGLTSTDVFTVGQTGAGGATTVDITARLRVTGRFGVAELEGTGAAARAQARAFFTAPRGVPGVTILEETSRDDSVRIDLMEDNPELPPAVGVLIEPQMTLRVEVGRAFALEKRLFLNLGFSNSSEDAVGGAAFGESALVSFDLPEGYFITSERGYSQGLPPIVPLPAGGLLMVTALGALGIAARRRRARVAEAGRCR